VKSNKKLKVVLDTNVLVSALVFGGTPRVTVETVLKDGTFIISAEILSELRRIIHTKFPLFIEHLERLEKLIKRDAVLVELGGVQVAVCRDPDDNKIIETAVIGNASYIVSRDKDSLVLRSYTDIVILDSTEFLKILE
jgi:putative PIN family toxin of toxin-antitoxin system